MNDLMPLLVTAFMTGLLGGVHCVSMCGGIIAALPAHRPRSSAAFPLPVVSYEAVVSASPAVQVSSLLAYNAGRLGSYAVAGALAGMVGSAALLFGQIRPLQHAGYLIANFFLMALGLYLAGVLPAFANIEHLGGQLWRRLAPRAAQTLSPPWAPTVSHTQRAFFTGALWGWVPCGLVYSNLIVAMTSGSSTNGAALLLAFGLGTLPNLLLAGVAAQQLRRWMQQIWVRRGAGAVIVMFGLWGLWRAHHLVQTEGGWFCTSPLS
jgi:sulfite exporter TauE/SafE